MTATFIPAKFIWKIKLKHHVYYNIFPKRCGKLLLVEKKTIPTCIVVQTISCFLMKNKTVEKLVGM